MLDFRTPTQRRTATMAKGRRQLAYLVLVAGLVIILGGQVANPRFWRWFDRLADKGQKPAERIDNRLTDVPAGHPGGDTLVMPPPVAEEEKKPADPPAVAEADSKYLPGVVPQYLEAIRDDTVFRSEESDAWFNLLGALKACDEPTIKTKSVGPATFAQLYRQSGHYRGLVVSSAGVVRRVEHFKLPTPRDGIEGYYRLAFSPNDYISKVMIVYCLSLPEGFPAKVKMEEAVDLEGIFFKRWLWLDEAGTDLYTSPLLLAKTVEWRQRPTMAREAEPDLTAVWLAVGGAAAFSAVLATFLYFRTRRRPRNHPTEHITIGEP